jgi:uncharacterized protein YbaP (TraB family)
MRNLFRAREAARRARLRLSVAVVILSLAGFAATSQASFAQGSSAPSDTSPAQSSEPSSDAPEAPAYTLVEEVEVIGRLPGPALWRVSTPTSQLWIVGMVGQMPKGFAWDNRRVVVALSGARELILPPSILGGVSNTEMVVDPNHLFHLPAGETVRGDLPPALAARLEAAVNAIGQKPDQYDHWRPVLSALTLSSAGPSHYGYAPQILSIAGLAKTHHVKLRPLANYAKGGDLIRDLAAAPPAAAQACMTLAVQNLERLPTDGPRRAAAWATGDLKTLRAMGNVRDMGPCFDAVPGTATMRDRAAVDWAKELGKVLVTPGKTVVAVNLDDLTRKGGLLDQLKAQGLDVIGPEYSGL